MWNVCDFILINLFKEKRKTVKHYLNNKFININLLNICKSNSVNLLKEKREAFKDFLNNNLIDNSLSDISNLNLISFLKETSSLKGKSKVVKNFLINKLNETLLTKRKFSIIRILSIKRNS